MIERRNVYTYLQGKHNTTSEDIGLVQYLDWFGCQTYSTMRSSPSSEKSANDDLVAVNEAITHVPIAAPFPEFPVPSSLLVTSSIKNVVPVTYSLFPRGASLTTGYITTTARWGIYLFPHYSFSITHAHNFPVRNPFLSVFTSVHPLLSQPIFPYSLIPLFPNSHIPHPSIPISARNSVWMR